MEMAHVAYRCSSRHYTKILYVVFLAQVVKAVCYDIIVIKIFINFLFHDFSQVIFCWFLR